MLNLLMNDHERSGPISFEEKKSAFFIVPDHQESTEENAMFPGSNDKLETYPTHWDLWRCMAK